MRRDRFIVSLEDADGNVYVMGRVASSQPVCIGQFYSQKHFNKFISLLTKDTSKILLMKPRLHLSDEFDIGWLDTYKDLEIIYKDRYHTLVATPVLSTVETKEWREKGEVIDTKGLESVSSLRLYEPDFDINAYLMKNEKSFFYLAKFNGISLT
jgi:hypothetical protein